MSILYMRFIARVDLKANPHVLFIWGDNLERTGMGGQAAEMRGEPNGVSIMTKKAPRRDDAAYFTDADREDFRKYLSSPYRLLEKHLKAGGLVVCPAAGVGTDRAALPEKAPACFKMLRKAFKQLGIIPPDWKNIP
jgi:hypothetical protein